jgi:hypothetical protein
MDEHNQYAKDVTPPTSFYMVELGDGWAPLCKILGKPIPDTPFPRANDTEALKGLTSQIFMEAGSRWAGIISVIGACAGGVWWLCKSGNI